MMDMIKINMFAMTIEIWSKTAQMFDQAVEFVSIHLLYRKCPVSAHM